MYGLFLTDLHLLSQRSIGQQVWERHQDEIAGAATVVLGGDIFDLRWSRLSTLHATIEAAKEWTEQAIAVNPHAKWIYLLGNHDCHPLMQDMLQTVAARHPNFCWHDGLWRMGKNVFMHGDILDAHGHRSGLEGYRATFHEAEPRGRFHNMMYSAVIQSRIHGVIPRVRMTRKRTCQRLLRYIQTELPTEIDAIENIFFGHTHIPMLGYRYDRFRFFNAGSGIRHLQCVPARFEVKDV